MQEAPKVPIASTGKSKLVFLWPENLCDRPGYYTLATTDGRFLGNLYRGTRLEAEVDPGKLSLVAFNLPMEASTGTRTELDVGTLRGEVEADRTYFVRLSFGEWDHRGVAGSSPPRIHTRTAARHMCRNDEVTLAVLSPRAQEWPQLRGWLDELDSVRSQGVAGDAWLQADPDVMETHAALASARDRRLRGAAVEITTVRTHDGVRVIHGGAGASGTRSASMQFVCADGSRCL